MKDSILEQIIIQGLDAGRDLAMFSWQGGEPTLMGLDFFRRVVDLQSRNMFPGQVVTNAFQTNGTLLDREWARFLRDHNFLVGISLDGPARLHDHYRKDDKKSGTHALVKRNLRILLEEGVEVNILTLLNDRNVKEPDRVYDFLLDTGVKHFQFVPCVEPGQGGLPASYSISPEEYGDFLCRLFDRWLDSSMDISVRDFDDLLALYQGHPANTCTYQPRCGGYMVVEHNGDVFPCDFFVLPKWRLGNVNETPLGELSKSSLLAEFGSQKSSLSEQCVSCRWRSFCYGGCLKHRVLPGRSVTEPTYFCESYRRLFEHSAAVLSELKS